MDNPVPPPVPKKRGCFFYGCIISLALAVLLLIGICLLGYFTVKTFQKMATDYTQSNPVQLEVTKLSPQELKPLQARIDVFNSGLKAHTNTPPLILTAREINALIAENPDFNGKVVVTLDGNKIKGQVSLPMDQFAKTTGFSWLHLDGRYLNGAGTFKVAIDNGQLFVFVDSIEANGKTVPESALAKLRSQNLADGFNKGPNTNMFQNYESLEVTNSTVIVKAKVE